MDRRYKRNLFVVAVAGVFCLLITSVVSAQTAGQFWTDPQTGDTWTTDPEVCGPRGAWAGESWVKILRWTDPQTGAVWITDPRATGPRFVGWNCSWVQILVWVDPQTGGIWTTDPSAVGPKWTGAGHTWTNTPPVPDALVGGVWQGTSTNSLQPGVIQFSGLILEDGQGRLFDENFVNYEIDVSSDGDEFSGTVRVYFLDGLARPTVLEGTITGTIDERDMMVGTWTASGETGDFSMAYSAPDYEIDVTLAGVADTWTFTPILPPPNMFSATVTIDAAGNLNGQDSVGCVYSGTLTDPAFQEDQFNGLLLDWEITDSGVSCLKVGNYSGQAGLIEDATDPDVLLIAVDDDTLAISFLYVRQ